MEVIVLIWRVPPKEDDNGDRSKMLPVFEGILIRSIWVAQFFGIKKARNTPTLKKLSTNCIA